MSCSLSYESNYYFRIRFKLISEGIKINVEYENLTEL